MMNVLLNLFFCAIMGGWCAYRMRKEHDSKKKKEDKK